MRLVYLDEAGIANLAHDPHVVIAGSIIHPDRQWKALATYYREMAMDLFPDDGDPYEFVFHAKDVWHGSDVFERDKWTLTERMKVLYRLAQVPHLFEIPIAIGFINRVEFREEELKRHPGSSDKAIKTWAHVWAFVLAIRGVDAWMEKNAPGEVAMLIAEDNHQMRELLEWVHGGYSFPGIVNTEAFMAKNIVDTIHFAKKDKSILLQTADHAAFIMKRHLMKCPHIKKCYSVLYPRLTYDPTPVSTLAFSLPLSAVGPVGDSG